MKKISQLFSNLVNQALEALAASQFKAERYREAAELYKKLLQNSDKPEWRNNLAICYLQRSLSLGEKGQVKEAITLWENYRDHASPPYENFDHYLLWLLQSEDSAKISAALQQLSIVALDQHYFNLAKLLGLLIIAGRANYQEDLPQDSTFVSQLKIAQAAWQAFQEHNGKATQELLKQLPYRSVFRDFRSMLKGMVMLPASSSEAGKVWAAVPKTSVYAKLALLLIATTLAGSELAAVFFQISAEQCQWLGKLLRLSKAQLRLAEQLNKAAGSSLSDRQQFDLATQHQDIFGNELAEQFCLSLLPQYPAGGDGFKSAFPASAIEELRIRALHAETTSTDAIDYWRQYIQALPTQSPERNLKIALILRRLAFKEDAGDKVGLLIESLDYDPNHRDCYPHILEFYRHLPDRLHNYQFWLKRALAQFPGDAEFLGQAMQASQTASNHQQTRSYALAVLKADPLNSAAKSTLLSNYLSQARTLLKAKSYEQVAAELALAEDLKMGQAAHNQIQLLRGFLHFARVATAEGLQLIIAALQESNPDPVNSYFQATMEASLLGQPVATILKALPPANEHLFSNLELARLITLIDDYAQQPDYRETLHKALEAIKATLKKSILEKQYAEKLLLQLCQTLDSIKHFELLRICAAHAHTRWLTFPFWGYYKVYADTYGNPEECSYEQVHALKFNYQQALQNDDHRTALMINKFLNDYYTAHPQTENRAFLENALDLSLAGPASPFEELFNYLPDEIFYQLDKHASQLSKKTSPEQLLKELGETVTLDQKLLINVVKIPDLFSALMMLKAAKQLNIEILVSIEDIFAAFDAQ